MSIQPPHWSRPKGVGVMSQQIGNIPNSESWQLPTNLSSPIHITHNLASKLPFDNSWYKRFLVNLRRFKNFLLKKWRKKVVHTRDTESLNWCLSLNLHLYKPWSLLLPYLLHITCHVSHVIITPKMLEQGTCIFKESALRADSFYKSKCPYVCWFVCLSVCLSHFSLRLTIFLPPLPKVQCPIFLDIWNPWGKSNEKSGFRF